MKHVPPTNLTSTADYVHYRRQFIADLDTHFVGNDRVYEPHERDELISVIQGQEGQQLEEVLARVTAPIGVIDQKLNAVEATFIDLTDLANIDLEIDSSTLSDKVATTVQRIMEPGQITRAVLPAAIGSLATMQTILRSLDPANNYAPVLQDLMVRVARAELNDIPEPNRQTILALSSEIQPKLAEWQRVATALGAPLTSVITTELKQILEQHTNSAVDNQVASLYSQSKTTIEVFTEITAEIAQAEIDLGSDLGPELANVARPKLINLVLNTPASYQFSSPAEVIQLHNILAGQSIDKRQELRTHYLQQLAAQVPLNNILPADFTTRFNDLYNSAVIEAVNNVDLFENEAQLKQSFKEIFTQSAVAFLTNNANTEQEVDQLIGQTSRNGINFDYDINDIRDIAVQALLTSTP